MIPQLFNGIDVWRLCWPQKDIETMVFKPGLGLLAGVLEVIILLEDNITYRYPIIAKAGLKILLQNLGVKIPIHYPINHASIPKSIPQHAASDHHRSSPKLLSTLHQPITQALSNLF